MVAFFCSFSLSWQLLRGATIVRLSLMKVETSDTIEIGDKENGGTGGKERKECEECKEYDGDDGADELLSLVFEEAQRSAVAMVDLQSKLKR